jgi:hypothetical protein
MQHSLRRCVKKVLHSKTDPSTSPPLSAPIRGSPFVLRFSFVLHPSTNNQPPSINHQRLLSCPSSPVPSNYCTLFPRPNHAPLHHPKNQKSPANPRVFLIPIPQSLIHPLQRAAATIRARQRKTRRQMPLTCPTIPDSGRFWNFLAGPAPASRCAFRARYFFAGVILMFR